MEEDKIIQEIDSLVETIGSRCKRVIIGNLNNFKKSPDVGPILQSIKDNMENLHYKGTQYLEDCLKKGLVIEAANTEGKIAALLELDTWLQQDIKEYKSFLGEEDDNND